MTLSALACLVLGTFAKVAAVAVYAWGFCHFARCAREGRS